MSAVVSVVVPTHNRRDLLLRLLDSLAAQSVARDALEIIVVHNYTDDGTEEAVSEWAQSNDVSLCYHRKNYSGPAASRQFGAREASGEYIAFIDDDCVATSQWLDSALETMVEDAPGHIGLCQGCTTPMPDQTRRFLEKTVNIDHASIYFETCNILYRRSVFEEVEGFSPEFLDKFYGEDTDLGWKVVEAGYETRYIEEMQVYHEVFHVGVWHWLKEPLFFVHLPYLARKFPAFREHMFYRYFLTLETALFQGFLIGVIATPLTLWTLLATLPYLVQRYRSGKHIPSRIFRVARIVAGLPRSLLTWFALVRGSVRYRSALL
ncbi:MAG: glycosyltransferase [Pseudomonadota bacterium]